MDSYDDTELAFMKFGVGQPVLRKEDEALLRGNGRYVGDHAPAGLLHATVLRSPHAHARFQISVETPDFRFGLLARSNLSVQIVHDVL